MFHSHRVWCVCPAANAGELARQLTEMTWCCCNGFSLRDYLFLNDATSPDGAQEYAVLKRCEDGRFLQIESITFGWCDETKALGYLQEILAGGYDRSRFSHEVQPVLETPEQHGRCRHCA
jgi:hypothetical protein